MALWSWRWFLALWLFRQENRSFTSQPEAFVDVNHMWSLQLFEDGLQSVRIKAQLGPGRVQQTNSTTLPSQPKEGIKALEAALSALPDNVDLSE